MFTAYLVVTCVAIAANAFSGIAAMLHFKPIFAAMEPVGVPVSWLRFPIGPLKTAGAVGLLLGLLGLTWVGVAAAAGLILFFACAIHTHLLARDYSPTFYLGMGFLTLAAGSLALGLAV